TPKNTIIDGHEYVDLGLSVMWATCNIGAREQFEHGSYYAWGETRTRSDYSINNSVTHKMKLLGIAGNPQYDVASAVWGGTWRLPTKEEMEELIKRCRWEWIPKGGYRSYNNYNGCSGYKVTAQNGNSIFLPTTGFIYGKSREYVDVMGKYLSATAPSSYPRTACDMVFLYQKEPLLQLDSRGIGCCVRPVSPLSQNGTVNTTKKRIGEFPKVVNETAGQINGRDYVDLGLSVNWAKDNIQTTPFDSYFAWGEINAKPHCTIENSLMKRKVIGNIAGIPQYDAATANWGEPWRMPTKEEFEELIIECHWYWMYEDNGYEITGPTGRSIFLPANGLCNGQGLKDVRERLEYWSASPHQDFTMAAYSLVSYTAGREDIKIVPHSRRSEGRCIRPVADRV
ncbi:MAG: hypothetical protein LUD72_00675, partial [Bacteroidales bacterium]|nr:hypothetical protein [Bacteroidales bacterium]